MTQFFGFACIAIVRRVFVALVLGSSVGLLRVMIQVWLGGVYGVVDLVGFVEIRGFWSGFMRLEVREE